MPESMGMVTNKYSVHLEPSAPQSLKTDVLIAALTSEFKFRRLSPLHFADTDEKLEPVEETIRLLWKTSGYAIEAEIELNPDAQADVRCVTLSTDVRQSDEAAIALNNVKCKLSHDYSLTVHDSEAAYTCPGCSHEGCGYCERLVNRFQKAKKQEQITQAAAESLKRMQDFPKREEQFIAAIRKSKS